MGSTATLSLVDIAQEYSNIISLIDSIENPEELDDSLWSKLYKVEGILEEKIESYAYVIKKLQKEAEFLEKEIKRLRERREIREKKIEWLRDHVKEILLGLDLQKVETAEVTVKIQNNPPSVKIIDEMKVPVCFKELSTQVSISKKEILEHFKETGEIPEGCDILIGKSLRIT